jgi:hypothetical protein
MAGGRGDDTYIIDNRHDTVTEAAGRAGGIDLVKSSVSYTLGARVENLALTGSKALAGTGNGLANHIHGNAGANHLSGGGGADILDGGAGRDVPEVPATTASCSTAGSPRQMSTPSPTSLPGQTISSLTTACSRRSAGRHISPHRHSAMTASPIPVPSISSTIRITAS